MADTEKDGKDFVRPMGAADWQVINKAAAERSSAERIAMLEQRVDELRARLDNLSYHIPV